ncbi:MAG: membrane dipeptidase [Flavobacteriaceae bacterium]
MAKGNVKIAFVSFYPFEKGFFKSPHLNNKIVAVIASLITSIGYKRIRYIQKHQNYFTDLMNEYNFLLKSKTMFKVKNEIYSWELSSPNNVLKSKKTDNKIFVIPTIEGAHVFNTGLTEYGSELNEQKILENIQRIKSLKYPPLFITFAHNFNNDLCGHAPSLEPLKGLVDQRKNLDSGISNLGHKVIRELLKNSHHNRILIDIKHMSLESRLQYYKILEAEFNNSIPIIVSHGAVTGRRYSGKSVGTISPNLFANDSINFYDEELIKITNSKGLFAIQFDAKRLAPSNLIKKPILNGNKEKALENSTQILWRQIQHVAETLDAESLPAWETCCIGSDFDGTINPLNEIWTSEDFNKMANVLLYYAKDYLQSPNTLKLQRNKLIDPETLVSNFCVNNVIRFMKECKKSNVRDYVLSS